MAGTFLLVVLAGATIGSLPALAGPGPDSQKSADAAAASYEEAQVRVGEIDAQIRQLEEQIAALRAAAQRRAVSAYKDTGSAADVFTASDAPLDAARREKLLEQANAGDNEAVTRLARMQEALDARRADQQAALEKFREQAARLAAAQKAQAGYARDNSPSPASAGGLICPVRGPVSFVDSWHAARAGGRPHEGVDLMAPRGTPNVATVSGSVTMKSGGISGNGVHLQGDNGDLYYYFHLDSYEGGARHVTQGEVIGYTGNTGDASGGATHTHFEVHPGGGGAVNPYPIVRPIC
ncbi:MAG TPA: M23 family metallopeptidase [Acidimicrobiia bacterium]|nr:M23 family metallopeptidase [Acidimicrobiia bacterium]